LAQSFFCIVSAIALFISRWWIERSNLGVIPPPTVVLIISLSLTIAVFCQLILGAIMRHSQAGLVVPDFPFAFGSVFPSLSADSLHSYETILIQRDLRLAADGPVSSFQIVIHLLHRYWGFALGLGSLLAAIVFFRHRGISTILKVAATSLPVLLLLQAFLGYETIASRKDPIIATLHQTNGALVLASLVLFSLVLARLRYVSQRQSFLQSGKDGA
jgi:cytochrome c oxidase assembly protein subunit 15